MIVVKNKNVQIDFIFLFKERLRTKLSQSILKQLYPKCLFSTKYCFTMQHFHRIFLCICKVFQKILANKKIFSSLKKCFILRQVDDILSCRPSQTCPTRWPLSPMSYDEETPQSPYLSISILCVPLISDFDTLKFFVRKEKS